MKTWLLNMSTQNATGATPFAYVTHFYTDLSSPPSSFSLLRTQQLSAAGAAGTASKKQTESSRKKKRQDCQLSHFHHN